MTLYMLFSHAFYSTFIPLPLYSRRAAFSQSNEMVDIAGPGVSITSTVVGGGYASSTGTSMATPHVTGAIARVWSVCRSCSAAQVEQCLLDSASGNGRRTDDIGYGLVRAEDTYTCLVETVKCCAQEEVETTAPASDAVDTPISDTNGLVYGDFPDPVPRTPDPEPPVPTPPVPVPTRPTPPVCRRRQKGQPCRRNPHCCSQKCNDKSMRCDA
jgi:subtilisin family serine protease